MRPVTAENALQMAALTRDFHPWQVVPQAAKKAGQPSLVLHSAWISGLVSTALEQMASSGRVIQWSIKYHGSAYLGERLVLEACVVQDAKAEPAVKILFRVLGPARKLVAEGEALINEAV